MKKNTLAKVLYIVVIVAVVALLWSTVTQTDRSTRELSSYAELEKKIEAGEIYGVAMYDSQSGTNVILAVTKAHEQNFKNIESRYDYLVRFNGTETSYDDFYAGGMLRPKRGLCGLAAVEGAGLGYAQLS